MADIDASPGQVLWLENLDVNTLWSLVANTVILQQFQFVLSSIILMHQFIHFQLFNSILFSKMHIVILDKWVVQNDRKENVTSSKIELL